MRPGGRASEENEHFDLPLKVQKMGLMGLRGM